MCPFFSNGDRYEVDCGRNVLSITLQHWQDVKLGASACSSCMPNFVQCSAHSCSEPGQKRDWWQRQDSWKPSHGSISNQGFCQHKVSGVCQPQTFSAFNIVKDTLFIDLTLCEIDTVKRTVLLQLSLADTRMCALSLVLVIDMNWIAAQMSYQLQHNTGKTLKCNVIPGADRIPGSLNTAASATKESSSHKV